MKFPKLPTGRYKVILADPAWAYATYTNKKAVPQRAEVQWYDTLTLDELKQLPVADMADKDCLLIMWVISSHVDQGIELAKSWGFKFKSLGPVWCKTCKGDPEKPKIGMGHWFRQEVEIALVFSRGHPKRTGRGVRQWLMQPAREHSRKPDDYYERIEALIDGPYLELFSRTTRPGWTAWGNQVGKFDTPRRQRSYADLVGA